MIVCPNVSSKEWKDLVEAVGEHEAYRSFIGNGYEIPTAEVIESANIYSQMTSGMEDEVAEDISTKISHLKGVFARHGIEVNITTDSSITENANVTGKNIVLNPNLVMQDSVPHEFGHIYIDLLGYDHPIIQDGINQLRGTDLWNEISETYKNEALTMEEFHKEVLVTAIGREYEHQTNQSRWQMWLNRLFRTIGELFGVDRNVSRMLALDMINGDLRTDFQGVLSDRTQKQISPVDKALQAKADVVAALEKKVKIYAQTQNDVAKRKLNAALSSIREAKAEEAILRFIKFADKQTLDTLDRLEKYKKATENPTNENAKIRLSLRRLSRLASYMESFNIINDVAKALKGQEIDDIDFGKVTIDSAFLDKHIRPILGRITDMQEEYRELSIPFIADFLLPYNTNRDLTREDLISMLKNVTEDISFTQRWGDSLAESPDQVLALFDRVIAAVKGENQRKATEFRLGELKAKTLALEKFQQENGVSINDFEKMYDFMLERNKDGELTGKYKNPKLDASDPRQAFYEMFSREYRMAQSLLPPHYRKGNQLITRVKEGTELIWETKGVSGVPDMIKQGLKDKFGRTVNDTDFVEVFTDEAQHIHRFIPVHFTRSVGTKENQINPNHLSLDMASNLYMFKKMAMNFNEMNKILPELEAVKNAVLTRTLEVKDGTKTVVDRDTGKPLVKAGIDTNAAEQLIDFFNRNVYGQHKEDEGTLFGIEGLDKAKVLDSIGGATSIIQLGVNVYSGINNLVVGQLTNFMEGTSGQFYNKKDWLGAVAEYDLRLPSIIADSTRRFKESKLEVWAETFDIFQEFDEYGRPIPPANIAKRFGTGALFFLNSAGEHMIQSQLAIAMAKHHRVKEDKIYSYNDYVLEHNKKFNDETRKEFEELPQVWESFDVKEGKLDTKILPGEMQRFTERIKGVSQRLHGNYAKKDQAALKKWAIGRLIMKFRNWLKPGWNRRFAKETFDGKDVFDQRLGSHVAGNYTITFNFIKSLVKDTKGFSFELMTTKWDELPEWKKQGIKRTVAEIAFIGASFLIVAALTAGDDDDDNWIAQMAEYQARRLRSELLVYVNPFEAFKILRSPAASLSLVEKTGKFAKQLLPFAGYEEYEAGPHKGELKLTEYGKDLIPVYSQIERLKEVEEQVGWLKK